MHMVKDFFNNGDERKGFAMRTFVAIFFLILVAYFTSRNWQWYSEDLSDEGIRPEYASPFVNIIIFTIYFLSFSWLWSFCLKHHPNPRFINTMFALILLLTFTFIVYMFEQRSFTFPKWMASLTLLLMLYLIYDFYVRGLYMLIFAMLVHFLIIVWATIQLWYSDAKHNDCGSHSESSSCSSYSHPWSSCPGYSKWYPKPKSHGRSSCSSKKWW